MSGYGLAAEASGNLFFATGNSGGVYTGTTNLQESVVKVGTDLSVQGHFTPANVADLDAADRDFGSGGVMVLPDQPGSTPHIAVAAGKDGTLYILNRDNLGGLSQQPSVPIGFCNCGPTYYKGLDGVGRVVSSGGQQAKTWKISSAGNSVGLQMEASADLPAFYHDLPSGAPDDNRRQEPGFFTSVSSNGTSANTAIIWAIGRAAQVDPDHITLYAFDGTASGGKLPLLWSGIAGAWPAPAHADANLVPTVANGRVYVASYKQLAIASVMVLVVPKYPVPTVTGEASTQAEEQLTSAGFKVTVNSVVVRDCANIGLVVSQAPVGGTLLAQGSAVTITIGQKPPNVIVRGKPTNPCP